MGTDDALVASKLHANASRRLVDLFDAGLGLDGNALLLQGGNHHGSKFGIIAAKKFLPFQHRHLGAEAAVGLGHFKADGSAADDDEMAWQYGVAEDRFIGEEGHCIEAGMGGTAARDPVAMTMRRASKVSPPASRVWGPMNFAVARTTFTPRLSKRACESWGAIVAITRCTWAMTEAKSTPGSWPAMPKPSLLRCDSAAFAAASMALDGTQPVLRQSPPMASVRREPRSGRIARLLPPPTTPRSRPQSPRCQKSFVPLPLSEYNRN